VAAAAVQGVDGLAAYFGRYLPQGRARVPRAARGPRLVGAIDPTSAAIMLVTLRSCPSSCG
jgi:ABC-type transport system involved in cytochrome bd biosynthesis fused ATPase/permease subunit